MELCPSAVSELASRRVVFSSYRERKVFLLGNIGALEFPRYTQ
jgi:hypothetical protein